MPPFLGDVDLVAEHELERLREMADRLSGRVRDGGAVHGSASPSSCGGRRTPSAAAAFRVLHDLFDVGSADRPHGGEKAPTGRPTVSGRRQRTRCCSDRSSAAARRSLEPIRSRTQARTRTSPSSDRRPCGHETVI
jgi:hypothetical protein